MFAMVTHKSNICTFVIMCMCVACGCDYVTVINGSFPFFCRNHFFSFTETATDYSFIVDKELLKGKQERGREKEREGGGGGGVIELND